MKSLIQILGFLSAIYLLTGCDPIVGTLLVNKSFKAISADPNNCNGAFPPQCNQPTTVTIPQGQFDVSFEMRSKQEAVLSIEVPHNTANVSLRIPSGKTIPENGAIQLSAKESGQPFDLSADIKTEITRTDTRTGVESCNIEWQNTVCGVTGYPPVQSCWIERHYRQGRRQVEYYYQDTNKTMQATILDAQSHTTSAKFQGSRQTRETIYTYDSGCY